MAMTIINPRGRASNPPIGSTTPNMTTNTQGTYSIAYTVTNSADQSQSQTRSGSYAAHGKMIAMGMIKPPVSGGRMFPR